MHSENRFHVFQAPLRISSQCYLRNCQVVIELVHGEAFNYLRVQLQKCFYHSHHFCHNYFPSKTKSRLFQDYCKYSSLNNSFPSFYSHIIHYSM